MNKLTKQIEKIIHNANMEFPNGDNLEGADDWYKGKATEQILSTVKEYIAKDIIGKDEPQYPSGMDRHDIDVRNELREELRNERN